MVNIGEIIKKYIELRDRKAEIAKRQSEEVSPLNEAMACIENYLMHTMNIMGVDQLKDADVGTAFKSHATSVQLVDAGNFKQFVLHPAVEGLTNYLTNTGYALRDMDRVQIASIVNSMPMWDLIDFHAGTKGIVEYVKDGGQVPGTSINTVVTLKVRRA